MTVLEVIQKSAEFLVRKGVDSPRLQAELLLAHVLKLPRLKLYLNFERKLTDTEADSVREFIKRRGSREPLQHIIGSTSFCGFEIAVSRHVLVPRPETEVLAEAGWQWLEQSRTNNPAKTDADAECRFPARPDSTSESQPTGLGAGAPLVLDFGTGSGCIAIALAVKCPGASVVALDVSPAALALAHQNAERNGVATQVQFVQSDGFTSLPADFRCDLIISNPPYIPSDEIATLQPEVRDFDPRSALDGGADGLSFYRRLAAEAAPFLNAGGRVMLEFGDGQAGKIKTLFEDQKWIVEAIRADYSHRQRILIARR